MSTAPGAAARFDAVARPYRWLEYLAFGRALERARLAWIDRLRDADEILVLGDGDGRALRAIVERCPRARVRAIDVSARMTALARRRLSDADRGRVSFEQSDIRAATYPPAAYDAVVTLFVLDCFSADDVAAIIDRVLPSLRLGGIWIWSDFQIPPRGWRRLHARLWVGGLYRAFRVMTGLEASALPPAPGLLAAAGLVETERRDTRAGLLTARVFCRRR